MKESPIPFKGDMVRAILAGQKTQTRRPINPQPAFGCHYEINGAHNAALHLSDADGTLRYVPPTGQSKDHMLHCPYGQPGDRLWVRETFAYAQDGTVVYCASMVGSPWDAITRRAITWHPSIHMPRAICRITLEITDIRVERVQNITSDGAIAEGAYEVRKVGDDIAHATWTMDGLDWRYDTPREAFAATWDSLYAARSLGWDVNPWVWVVTFKRAEEVCQKN